MPARIVEVKHRCHGVDAQPVHVVTVEPKKRVANHKTAHFVTAVVKNITVPLRLHSLARVGVLEKMTAVECREPMRIAGKMRWHPIEDHADVVSMQRIDEEHQILRRAVIRRRRKVTGDLITPGTEEGMVHHRQKFHVSEPHAL